MTLRHMFDQGTSLNARPSKCRKWSSSLVTGSGSNWISRSFVTNGRSMKKIINYINVKTRKCDDIIQIWCALDSFSHFKIETKNAYFSCDRYGWYNKFGLCTDLHMRLPMSHRWQERRKHLTEMSDTLFKGRGRICRNFVSKIPPHITFVFNKNDGVITLMKIYFPHLLILCYWVADDGG